MNPIIRVMTAVLVLALAACSRDEPEPAPPAPTTAPAPAPPTEPATPPATPPAPEDDIAAGTSSPTGFHGFGPAKFGDTEESVRIAWGRPMAFDPPPSDDQTCTYLFPDPRPTDSFDIAFMFEDGKFVRYDVNSADYEAPGSGRIGNSKDALEALYAGRYSVMPHKYVEGGHYFVVSAPEGGDSKLVFEIGADGLAARWRVGTPPQVDYVEGCS